MQAVNALRPGARFQTRALQRIARLYWWLTAAAVLICLTSSAKALLFGSAWRNMVVAESFLILTFCLWPVVIRLQSSEPSDYLDPGLIICLAYMMVFAVRPLFLLSSWGQYVDLVPTEVFGTLTFDDSDLALVLLFALIGLLFFHLGYRTWRIHPLRHLENQASSSWSSRRVTCIAGAGILFACLSACLIWPVIGGLDGAISNFGMLRGLLAGYGYHSLGLDLLPVVVLVLWVDHLRGNRRPIIVPLLLISNLYNLMIGSRAGVFNLWFFMFLAHRYLKPGRLRWGRLTVSMLAAGVLIFAVWLGVLRNERIADWQEVAEVTGKVWEATPAGVLGAMAMLEFDQSDIFAAVLHAGPQVFPFLWGRSFLDLAFQPVPRALWNSKPSAFDVDIGWYFVGLQTAIPPSIVGELYLNFHVVGVILGMLFIGWVVRRFYERALSAPREPGRVLLYSVIFPYVPLLVLRSFMGAATTALALAIPASLAVLYITREQNQLRTLTRDSVLTSAGGNA